MEIKMRNFGHAEVRLSKQTILVKHKYRTASTEQKVIITRPLWLLKPHSCIKGCLFEVTSRPSSTSTSTSTPPSASWWTIDSFSSIIRRPKRLRWLSPTSFCHLWTRENRGVFIITKGNCSTNPSSVSNILHDTTKGFLVVLSKDDQNPQTRTWKFQITEMSDAIIINLKDKLTTSGDWPPEVNCWVSLVWAALSLTRS